MACCVPLQCLHGVHRYGIIGNPFCPSCPQLVLDACRQGAELDSVLAPVERWVVQDPDDTELEDYDEETDEWIKKFEWGTIQVGMREDVRTQRTAPSARRGRL